MFALAMVLSRTPASVSLIFKPRPQTPESGSTSICRWLPPPQYHYGND